MKVKHQSKIDLEQAWQSESGAVVQIIFPFGCKEIRPVRASKLRPPDFSTEHLPLSYQAFLISYLTIVFISATNFTSERKQLRSHEEK